MISKFSVVSKCPSLICVIHLVNGAQFLKATLALLPLFSIFPITKIYASKKNHKD